EHAGLAVFFLEDLHALFGQALDGVLVGLRRDLERRVDLVAGAGIERDRILRVGEIEEIAAGAQEHDALGAPDFFEAEQLGVEFFGAVEIFHRDGEVQNAFGLDHRIPTFAGTITRSRGFKLRGAGGVQWGGRPVAPDAPPRQRRRAPLELAAFEVIEPVLVDRYRGGAPGGSDAGFQRALRERADQVGAAVVERALAERLRQL